MDLIQKEYGWKDKYVLEDISYTRFKEIIRVLQDRMAREHDRDTVNNLFSTYQTVETLLAVNSGKKYKGRSFKKYLSQLGMKDLIARNFKITDSERDTEIGKASNNVKDVVSFFNNDGKK